MAEERLGDAKPGLPSDVLGEGVAYEVRMDMGGDAGAVRDPMDGPLDRLAGAALRRVLASEALAAEAASVRM
jgi:hypothetical protein